MRIKIARKGHVSLYSVSCAGKLIVTKNKAESLCCGYDSSEGQVGASKSIKSYQGRQRSNLRSLKDSKY